MTLEYLTMQRHALSKFLPYPNNENRLVFNYPNSLCNKLVNFFQKSASQDDSGVYTIQCNQCDKIYVGQTGHGLHQNNRTQEPLDMLKQFQPFLIMLKKITQ